MARETDRGTRYVDQGPAGAAIAGDASNGGSKPMRPRAGSLQRMTPGSSLWMARGGPRAPRLAAMLRRLPVSLVLLVALAVPARAGAVSLNFVSTLDAARLAWSPVTGTQAGPTEFVSLLRQRDGALRVVWPAGGSLQQALIGPRGAVTQAPAILSGWQSVSSPGVVELPDGTLDAFFGGIRTQSNRDPNRDLNLATSTDRGATWSVVPGGISGPRPGGSDDAYTSPISAVVAGTGHQPIEAWTGGGRVYVHVGTSPATQDVEFGAGDPSGADIAPAALLARLATSPSGAVELAWFSQRPAGVFVQGVNPDTGAPIGIPRAFPGIIAGTQITSQLARTPLVQRPVFGGTFSAYHADWPTSDGVRVWAAGQPQSKLALPHAAGRPASTVALDSDATGHLWLAYTTQQHGRLVLITQRSDAVSSTAVFGSRVEAALPVGTSAIKDVELSGRPGAADVLVTALVGGGLRTFAAQTLPGLSMGETTKPANGGRRELSFTVTDAGQPVRNARIDIRGHTLATDGKGHASITLAADDQSHTAAATHVGYVATALRVKT